jgi:hypothetical protein
MVRGYIVIEPDLRIERVPARLLEEDSISWPNDPGATNPKDLYHRESLVGTSAQVRVWSVRDHTALPARVTETIRRRAAEDGPFLDHISPFDYRDHHIQAWAESPGTASVPDNRLARIANVVWTVQVGGVQVAGFQGSADDEEHQIRDRVKQVVDEYLSHPVSRSSG